jgi:hypothetical protein
MSIDIGAEIEIDLTPDGTGKDQKRENKRQQEAQRVYQYPLTPNLIPLIGGAGILQEPTQYGPPVGFMWSIRRLTITGYTAGTVTPYLDGIEPIAFPAAGTYFIGRGELLLDNGQQLTFVATGITGTPMVFGVADAFPRDELPAYLGVARRDS